MDMNEWLSVLVPLAVALAATIPGILAYINQRRKAPAEAAEIITGAAANIVEKLERQVTALEGKIADAFAELEKTRGELRVAQSELIVAQGQLRVLRLELDQMHAENLRLEAFADGCRNIINDLSALLKRNGVEVPQDGLTPS